MSYDHRLDCGHYRVDLVGLLLTSDTRLYLGYHPSETGDLNAA